ncbi:MAG: hypothetical protein DMG15_08430 [Acidobacteria bacterium]|nr:MAG: hypothetical protein DMG15_08430 [Acidobacteriota bacterium]
MTKVKKLKVLFSFLRLPDDGLVSRLNAIHDSIAGNAAFPSPPVDLAAFKAAISNYAASIVVALDGSKQAIGNKKKLREVAVNMVEQLGHYVEANSNDDPVTFVSSGFEIRPTNRVPPLPLDQPQISRVDQGKSGELLVKVTPVQRARHYEIRYGALGTGGTPATTFGSTAIASAQKAASVDNLTPGTTYTFQVRAYGKLGFTEWSNPVQRMCI